MKKIVVGVIAVLGIAALAVPFGCGLVMERMVRETLGNFNTMYAASGQDISAEIVRYDRGYSSSEIEWKIKFGRMKAIYGVDEVVFVERAEHGLHGIVSNTSLEKNSWYTAFVSSRLAGQDPLHITTKFKFNGEAEATVALDAFVFQAERDLMAVRAGKIILASDQAFKKFVTDASWEGMEVAGKFGLGGTSLQSELTMISPYIWEGKVSMAVQKAEATEGNERFDLTNLKLDYLLKHDKDRNTLSASAEYGVDSLNIGAEKLEKVFARIGISGVDGKGYEEFMKLYTATMATLLGDIVAAKDDPGKMNQIIERRMAVSGIQIVAAGEKLLTEGLELRISDLHVQVPEGEIKGEVLLGLKKDMTFAQFIPVVNQPSLALEIFTLKSALSLPEKLAGDDAAILFSPVYPGMQGGLFVKDGVNIRHTAETRDGKLYLNDEEVVLQ
jgi:uncharacterized protein YdgA (DUF945 family)